MYTNILGYKVFNKNKSELLKKIENMDKVNIVSGNPEVLYSGLNNEMLHKCAKEGKGVYLLGAQEEVLQECRKNLEKTIEGLKIVGYHNGFFDLDNCKDIVDDIKKSNPWALFVAMGCPRQEKFIEEHMDELPCTFYMGVGGSFDVFAGNTTRAPKWMISLGLEWLHRVLKEPWRIKRLTSIPKFLWRVTIKK